MRAHQTKIIIYAGLFTALTAAGAFIKIPLPPVPITLQTLFTILAGSLLPPRYAFTSQIVYLLLGLAGLPVFALGGGLGYVIQPSFGYLLGLPLAALLIAVCNSRWNKKKSFSRFFAINALGMGAILLLGTLWLFVALYCFLSRDITPGHVLLSGFALFVPGELMKAVIASYIAVYYYKRVESSTGM